MAGLLTAEVRALVRQQKPGILASLLAEAATSWGWLLLFPDRAPMPCCCTPAATQAEVPALSLGAVAAEPIRDTGARPATASEADELRTLIAVIYRDDNDDDRADAVAAALADAGAALACYRDIAFRRNPAVE